MAAINKFDVTTTPEEFDEGFMDEVMELINREYEAQMDDMAKAIKEEEELKKSA